MWDFAVIVLAPVVQKVDIASLWINLHPMDSAIFLLVSLILIHWIVIYPTDDAIQCLNNRALTPVTQIDNDINWINHCPADKAILFSLQYLSTTECFILWIHAVLSTFPQQQEPRTFICNSIPG